MRKLSLAAWVFVSLLLIASTLGFGQAGSTSAIQGTVQDKTGAAIVGADVTVSSPSTGFSRTVKTTDSYDPTKSRYALSAVHVQSRRSLNVAVNGIADTANTVSGPVRQPPQEAAAEFSTPPQRVAAGKGRAEAARINRRTPSGS